MPGMTFTSGFDQLIISWLVGHTVEDVERELIVRTLAYHRGSRTRAARDLKISIRTLRNKIQEYQSLGVVVPVPGDHPSIAKTVAVKHDPQASLVERLRAEEAALKGSANNESPPVEESSHILPLSTMQGDTPQTAEPTNAVNAATEDKATRVVQLERRG